MRLSDRISLSEFQVLLFAAINAGLGYYQNMPFSSVLAAGFLGTFLGLWTSSPARLSYHEASATFTKAATEMNEARDRMKATTSKMQELMREVKNEDSKSR